MNALPHHKKFVKAQGKSGQKGIWVDVPVQICTYIHGTGIDALFLTQSNTIPETALAVQYFAVNAIHLQLDLLSEVRQYNLELGQAPGHSLSSRLLFHSKNF